MKNKPPRPERISATDRLVDANRLFERDVLMESAPRREPRVRASIIGDKKLTARDQVGLSGEAKKENRIRNASPLSHRSRVVQTDAVVAPARELPRSDANALRRERGYSQVSPQTGLKKAHSRAVSSSTTSAVDDVRAKVSRKIIYRGVGLVLVISLCAALAYFATDPLTRLLERPLKSVAVEGQFQYLSKDRAMELINGEIDGDFLQLNLNRLKSVLMDDPWVEHVSLNRRWPDTLVVKISEQKPIARWDANGFLNQRGEIIRVKEADKLSGLPWLQGNEINAREIMQQYQDLSTLLRTRGLEIIALKCDNKKSWRLTLKNDVEIAIGRDQVMEKLRRFVTVYDNFLSSVWSDVKAIDVRYTNGVSVRWVAESEMAKKYVKPDVTSPKSLTEKPKTVNEKPKSVAEKQAVKPNTKK